MTNLYTNFTRYLLLLFSAILISAGPIQSQSLKTLTILGGNGVKGDIDPFTEASRDGGLTWHAAYLTGYHPWGYAPGTNSWVNFHPSDQVGLNSSTDYRIRFNVPADFIDPQMSFTIKADNYATVSINGVLAVAEFAGQSTSAADQVIAQAVQAGINEITIRLRDTGGLVGLNYRIDLSMISSEEPTTYVATSYVDITPPTALAKDITVYLDANGDVSITPQDVDNGSSDATGAVALSLNKTSFTRSNVGANTVTLTVTDIAGNVNTTTSTVNVILVTSGPGDISNGILTWLDASDIDNDANLGNNPANNASLNTWKDKSGNGHDAVNLSGQGTGIYKSDAASVINSNPVVSLSGNSVYNFADIDIRAISNPDITIITVYRQKASSNTGLWGNDNGAWDRFMYTNFSAFGNTNGIASRGPSQNPAYTKIPGSGVVDNIYLFTAIYDGEVSGGVNNGPANGSSFYFNGSLLGTFTDGTNASAAQTTLRLGFDGDDGYFNGDVAEMIVYDRVLTSCEIQSINAYLSTKYGITFSTASITADGPTTFCEGGSVTLNANTGAGLSYQWKLDNINISGANTVSYIATETGSYTVDITDECGTATSAVTNVVVNSLPTITCPSDISVNTDIGLYGANVSFPIAVVTGIPAPVVTYSQASGSFFPVGTTSVTATATSDCGSVSCTFDVKVSDATPPTVLTKDITIELDENGAATITPQQVDNGSRDASGPLTLSLDQTSFDCSNIAGFGTNAFALNFDGNDVVSINDSPDLRIQGSMTLEAWFKADAFADDWVRIVGKGTSGPRNYGLWYHPNGVFLFQQYGGGVEIIFAHAVVSGQWYHIAGVNNNGQGKLYIDGQLVATGNGGTTPAVSADPLTIGYAGFHTWHRGQIDEVRVWNVARTDQEIADNYNVGVSNSEAGLVAYYTMEDGQGLALTDQTGNGHNGALQAFSQANVWTGSSSALSGTANGGNTVTLTATDANNNSASATANVTVVDYIAPVIILNGNATETVEAYASYTDAGATATDNCNTPNVTVGGAVDVNTPGVYTLTYNASDASGNAAAQVNRTVTVVDNTPPTVITQNITVNIDASGNANITPSQIDNGSSDASGPVTLSLDKTDFDCSNLGENEVILTVTDVNNNSASAIATVKALDSIVPEITVPADISLFATSDLGAMVNYETPVGTDNCFVTTEMTSGLADGSTFPLGTTLITYTATDASGNEASGSFNVTVVGIAPEIVSPGEITVSNDAGICGAIVHYEATETLGIPASIITYTIESGSSFAEGTTSVTATATNAVGSSSCTFNVIVVDNEAPTLQVPANISQLNDAGVCGATIDFGQATAADNCEIASLVNDAPAFFEEGTTVVTWTATDIHGNETSAEQMVEVYNQAPVLESMQVSELVEAGETAIASAIFSDNNLISATWYWGDGSSSAGVITGQSVTGDYVYADANLFDVRLVIEDACGEMAEMTFSYVVSFSPCAGHITGGGYIDSYPGAYSLDYSLAGKAKFEFEAKYHKSKNKHSESKDELKGKFKFKLEKKNNKFEFSSENMQWLVVNGDQAIFNGQGKLGHDKHDNSLYTYLASIIDGDVIHKGDPDYIRLIIWDNLGNIVYENQSGDVHVARALQQIDKGSIKIHKGCDEGDDDHNGDKDDDKKDDKKDDKHKSDLIADALAFDLILFPNPVSDEINIRFNSVTPGKRTIEIYDLTGKVQLIQNNLESFGGTIKLNISELGLARGNYMLRVKNEETQEWITKLFKKE